MDATQPKPQLQLISVEEVAQMLGCSVRSVWRMRDLGRIPPPIKVGGRRLVR
jgi:predicted DNA-binding transcriptional regulator AlpA